jgi:hypothetical protein
MSLRTLLYYTVSMSVPCVRSKVSVHLRWSNVVLDVAFSNIINSIWYFVIRCDWTFIIDCRCYIAPTLFRSNANRCIIWDLIPFKLDYFFQKQVKRIEKRSHNLMLVVMND